MKKLWRYIAKIWGSKFHPRTYKKWLDNESKGVEETIAQLKST